MVSLSPSFVGHRPSTNPCHYSHKKYIIVSISITRLMAQLVHMLTLGSTPGQVGNFLKRRKNKRVFLTAGKRKAKVLYQKLLLPFSQNENYCWHTFCPKLFFRWDNIFLLFNLWKMSNLQLFITVLLKILVLKKLLIKWKFFNGKKM